VVEIRIAREGDEPALRALDLATWSTRSSPSPPPAPDRPVLERWGAANVLVAAVGDEVLGSLFLAPWLPLASTRHVLEIRGLAVDPARQGEGIGARLLVAAVARAREEGRRRLLLRVLATNDGARRLYERVGFEVEGTYREAFLLDGTYVDDLAMALDLTRVPPNSASCSLSRHAGIKEQLGEGGDWREDRVGAAHRGENPMVMARMRTGFAAIGDTQHLPGYSVLMYEDDTVRHLADLDLRRRTEFLLDLALLGEAVGIACGGDLRRVNYEVLGNSLPWLHGHVHARYDWEPLERIGMPVWCYPEDERSASEVAYDDARHGALRARITAELTRLMDDAYG
jgi:ribosomal protein S18 acetylase RimI-like enzyme/diadenosine tetraphosphate (Ap4A) HIT family hydrolase